VEAGASAPGGSEKLREATQSFEALFIAQLLSEVREAGSSQGEGIVDGGTAESVYGAELDWELAQKIAIRGPFGLAKALQTQLTNAAKLKPES